MAASFFKGDIILPYADDDETRTHIDELIRQLRAWKPGINPSGKKQRMDLGMVLWGVGIKWRAMHKRPATDNKDRPATTGRKASWNLRRSGLLVPSKGLRRTA